MPFFKHYNVCNDMLDGVCKTSILLNLFVFRDVTVGKAMIQHYNVVLYYKYFAIIH